MRFATEFSHLDEKGDPIDTGQVFTSKEKVYHYNKEKNCLEDRNEEVDVQEQINSCRDLTLSSILNRYLPGEDLPEGALELQDYEDELDRLSYFSEAAEEMKAKYNLDPSMSISEVFDVVTKKANEFKDSLAKQEESSKNGGVSDAQAVQESQQADI